MQESHRVKGFKLDMKNFLSSLELHEQAPLTISEVYIIFKRMAVKNLAAFCGPHTCSILFGWIRTLTPEILTASLDPIDCEEPPCPF